MSIKRLATGHPAPGDRRTGHFLFAPGVTPRTFPVQRLHGCLLTSSSDRRINREIVCPMIHIDPQHLPAIKRG